MKLATAAAILLIGTAGAFAQGTAPATTPTAPAKTTAPAAKPTAAPKADAAIDTCKSQAGAKKLAGAALKSFMTKCQKDASTACTKSAADNKLAGAAKTSFTKKCLTDHVGT